MKKRSVAVFVFALLFSISLVSAFPSDYVSYWSFDNNALDAKANYHGAEFGDVTYALGVFNQAAFFSGDSDYIDFGDITEMNNIAKLTFSVWLNQSGTSESRTIFTKIINGDNDISASTFLGRIYFEIGNGANTYVYWGDYSGAINNSEWYNLALVYDGTAISSFRVIMYIDGVPVLLNFFGTFPLVTAGLSEVHFLASGNTTTSWLGGMDELYFFNRSLNQTEIQELMAGPQDSLRQRSFRIR